MANREIIVRLRMQAADFSQRVKDAFGGVVPEAEKAGGESAEAMARGFDARRAALIGAIGSAGVAAVAAIKQSLDMAKELDSTSKQLGIGVEALQEWRYAANRAGTSASEFDQVLGDLRKKVDEAAGGNRKVQQTFVDLGVGFVTTSGHARETGGVLEDVAQRLAGITDPTERAKLEVELFGDNLNLIRPLLDDAASGLSGTTAEMERFGGVLTSGEIQQLNEVNAEFERLKQTMSINIAHIVAENAGAIGGFVDILGEFGSMANWALDKYMKFVNYFQTANIGYQERQARGETSGYKSVWEYDENFAAGQRAQQTGDYYNHSVSTTRDKEMLNLALYGDKRGPGYSRADVAPPRLTPAPTPTRRNTGGNRPTGPSKEEREAERAAEKALQNYQRMEESLQKQIQEQRALTAIEDLRAKGQTIMAADAEAQHKYLSQNPLAIHQTVDALAAALGLSKEQTAELEKQLKLSIAIDQYDQGEEADRLRAREKAFKDRSGAVVDRLQGLGEAARREAEAQAEHFRRAHEQAVMDVADLYEDLFNGGTTAVWKRFKSEGLRIVAEIAGAYTLALLSGNGGKFDLGAAFGASLGRSPLGNIFNVANAGAALFGGSGGGGPAAANDNSLAGRVAAGNSSLGGFTTRLFGGGGGGGSSGGAQGPGFADQVTSSLGQAGGPLALYAAAVTIANTLGEGIEKLTGVEYSKTGGLFGGLLGGFLVGAVKSTPRGSAIIGNAGGQLGVTGFYGNSQSRKDQAGSSATSLIDAIYQIADQLGAGVDASKGQVSIGIRKGNYVVDPQGRGYTKTSKFSDLQGFGADGEAATRAAISDLIRDGVLTGLSAAASNLLTKPGGDLEKQIEKALLIEQVPKLLKERLDPLGAALDTLYDKFKLVADAMREGGASAEQIAQARQLWELEKADAIASIGAASAQLKDFLSGLNAGSNSPLSLRQQRVEAEAKLAPFLAQIEQAQAARAEVDRLKAAGADAGAISSAEEAARIAAGKVDQAGFTSASELLLSISRQANASTGGFFGDFDRIRALTGQAIGLVDGAVPPASARDPFAELTAQNTGDMANILADHTRLLQAINDNIAMLAPGGVRGDFFAQNRALAT